MKIAVEGCAHGELEKIYDTIQFIENRDNVKVDLLICCGDFQSVRNEEDLVCMNVPQKYANMCTFYKYYSGELTAPILTVFIGGNHEASNYLQELPYGGWVAPNIYYLGYAGVINIAGIRIGGISGIYKSHDYHKGRYEIPPYAKDSIRSVYHIRSLDVFRLNQLTPSVGIFLSHDWPTNITNHGNVKSLLKFKTFFKKDIDDGTLGSPPCEKLLDKLQPSYYFAAHLHCKFSAVVPHCNDDGNVASKTTKFLALDKCLPGRRFLQLLDIEHDKEKEIKINYDLEWLTILFYTNHLVSHQKTNVYLPTFSSAERYNFTPSQEELDLVSKKFESNFEVPLNFVRNVPAYNVENPISYKSVPPPQPHINPQTTEFCEKLGIDNPLELIMMLDRSSPLNLTKSNNKEQNDASMIKSQSLIIPRSVEIKRKMNLSLPEPKMTKLELGNEETDEKNASFDANVEMENKIEENITSDKLCNDVDATVNATENTGAKFKRRNQNSYQEITEED